MIGLGAWLTRCRARPFARYRASSTGRKTGICPAATDCSSCNDRPGSPAPRPGCRKPATRIPLPSGRRRRPRKPRSCALREETLWYEAVRAPYRRQAERDFRPSTHEYSAMPAGKPLRVFFPRAILRPRPVLRPNGGESRRADGIGAGRWAGRLRRRSARSPSP